MQKNRILLAVAAVAVLVAAGFCVYRFVPFSSGGAEAVSSSMENDIRRNVSENFAKAASLLKGQLPKVMEDGVVLVGVEAGPGPVMTYRYRLNATPENGTDAAVKARLAERAVARQVCNTPELRDYMDYGASYTYRYMNDAGEEILKFTVDTAVCAGLEKPADKE